MQMENKMSVENIINEIVMKAPETHDSGVTNVTCAILNIFHREIHLLDKLVLYEFRDDGKMKMEISHIGEKKLTTLHFLIEYEEVRWHLEINNLMTFPEFVKVNSNFTKSMKELAHSFDRCIDPELV